MRYVPLLLFPFLLYNAFAFLIFTDADADFREALMGSVALPSGATFTLTIGVTVVLLALLLLAIELMKTARVGVGSFADHMVKVLLLAALLVEFFLVKQAATGTFLTLAMISLVDFACGVAIAPAEVRDAEFDDG